VPVIEHLPFNEHLPRKSRKKTSSSYAEHLIDNQHNYTDIDNNLEVLHLCHNKRRYLNVIEEYEIYKSVKKEPNFVLNDKSSFQSNIIYNTAVKISDSLNTRSGPDKDRGGEVRQGDNKTRAHGQSGLYARAVTL